MRSRTSISEYVRPSVSQSIRPSIDPLPFCSVALDSPENTSIGQFSVLFFTHALRISISIIT